MRKGDGGTGSKIGDSYMSRRLISYERSQQASENNCYLRVINEVTSREPGFDEIPAEAHQLLLG
jgi:hypothetical protein